MHDWTRIDPNDYHHFHGRWIFAIADSLNGGLLPQGYFALAEHTTLPIIPDVVTLTLPDNSPSPFAKDDSGGVAVLDSPTAIVATASGRKRRAAGRRRVAIQHARSRQIVAVIEIVSPSNKARKSEFADLIEKTVQLLRQGTHVLLIDPFPPTSRDPRGIHAAVWRELTGKSFELRKDKPLTVASYAALGADTYSAFVEPVGVGDPLPTMPLHLTDEYRVKLPLEETYQTAWSGYPTVLRELLESERK
ncbi:MAG: DUF4058 family protein [Gemmataceae bacterium]